MSFYDYLRCLKKPHKRVTTLDFLRSNGSVERSISSFNKLGGVFTDDGNLSVNFANGMRRRANIKLSNKDRKFDFDVNKIWFGQRIRLSDGLILPNGERYIFPQITGYITGFSENYGSVEKSVSIEISDKWCYLNGDIFGNLDGTYYIPIGSNIYTVINSILNLKIGMGNDVVDSSNPIFTDYYSGKTVTLTDGTVIPILNTPYTDLYEPSKTYADIILGMAKMLPASTGYDAMGQLRIEPAYENLSDSNKPIAYKFTPTEKEFLGATYKPDIQSVRNDIIVSGGRKEDLSIPMGRAQNRSPKSDTSVYSSIGIRTEFIEDSDYYSDKTCQALAAYELKKRTVLAKSVTIESIPIYHLQENQIVTILRPDRGGRIERHLVTGFSRNLSNGSVMTINATSVNDFEDIATIIPY